MTDSKAHSAQDYYHKLNTPNGRYNNYPQQQQPIPQVNQNYQNQHQPQKLGQPLYPQFQPPSTQGYQQPLQGYQPPNQGYQPPLQEYQPHTQGYQPSIQGYQQPPNHLYQQGGIYQPPITQNGYQYSHPNLNPGQQLPQNTGYPSVDPVLHTKKRYRRFYRFLWIAMFWEAIGFVGSGLWLTRFGGIWDFNVAVASILWTIQTISQLIASISSRKLIKAFHSNDTKVFLKGRQIFKALFIFEYLFVLILVTAYCQYQIWVGWMVFTLFVFMPGMGFLYIMRDCRSMAKQLEKAKNKLVVPYVC